VQEWVQEQWTVLELGADNFIHRLQTDIVKAHGRPADRLFTAVIEPLAKAIPASDPSIRLSRKPAAQTEKLLDPNAVDKTLQELEGLVGKPQDEPGEPPRLVVTLRDSADALSNEWSQKLAELSVHLIEEPAFRLAGAEESIRQSVATIEQVLQHHEPLIKDLSRKAQEAYDHLCAYCRTPTGQRRPLFPASDILELLRSYAKWRYQSLVLQHLTGAFVSLRGHLSDELREINFCRVRLGELLRLLEDPAGEPVLSSSSPSNQGNPSRYMLPAGYKDLREVVNSYLTGLTPEHLLELDGRMEEMLKTNFTALVNVCVTNGILLKDVADVMQQTAREYASELLPPTSVTKLFLEQHQDGEEAENLITEYYDEAAPEMAVSRSSRGGPPVAEMCVLAAPDDLAGAAFRQLVEKTLPQTEVQHAKSTDDIVIYRERNNLALVDLEQLGGVSHDAYLQMSTAENFTPHSRCDIDFRLQSESGSAQG
jgi:hypothetical protein